MLKKKDFKKQMEKDKIEKSLNFDLVRQKYEVLGFYKNLIFFCFMIAIILSQNLEQ